jgi:RNA polymerase sigma-70 factor (ECF subfamily)
MDREPPSTKILERYRRGDPNAADELYAHYARRLSRLAEKHLDRQLAARIDGDDVVQSVFRTFFRRSMQGEFQLDSRTDLWRLLVKITILKARQAGRRHTAAVRDVRAEQLDTEEAWLKAAANREPGPEEAAILTDQIEALLEGLPVLYRDLLQLRLQGYSAKEIVGELGVSRTTVYRALQLLQRRLRDNL